MTKLKFHCVSSIHVMGRADGRACVLELYMTYYNTYRCFWLLESDCTQLCKYIHIFVKFGPRQFIISEQCCVRSRIFRFGIDPGTQI